MGKSAFYHAMQMADPGFLWEQWQRLFCSWRAAVLGRRETVGQQEIETKPSGEKGALWKTCVILFYPPGAHTCLALTTILFFNDVYSSNATKSEVSIPLSHWSDTILPVISNPSFSWTGSPAFIGIPRKL